LRTTRLRGVDGTVWHVPNGEIRRVGNKSQDWSRCVIDVGVAYSSDLAIVTTTLQRTLDELAEDEQFAGRILERPQVLGVENLGDSSIDLRVIITTAPAQQWSIAREARRRIKEAFDKVGIEIPFPQMALNLPPQVGGNPPT
jgi:small conductance mechanosensitive channel